MQLEDYLEFSTDPVELIRIKGTRIDIDYVVELYNRRMTAEQIAVAFSCPLEPVQVYAAITYYLQNRESVDAYVARRNEIGEANQRRWSAQGPAAVVTRLREYKRQAAGAPRSDAS